MDFDEFLEYLEENCSAKESFLEKATDYLNEVNAPRRWSSSRIESEANKMWDSTVSKLYDNLKIAIKTKNNREKWIEFMDENEVLEGFAEGIDDMEFGQ